MAQDGTHQKKAIQGERTREYYIEFVDRMFELQLQARNGDNKALIDAIKEDPELARKVTLVAYDLSRKFIIDLEGGPDAYQQTLKTNYMDALGLEPCDDKADEIQKQHPTQLGPPELN